MSKTYKIAFLLLLGMMFATLSILLQKPWQTYGEVAVGDQTIATSTPHAVDLTVLCGGTTSGTGVLDSVKLYQYSTGNLLLLDATTSNISLRTNNTATSSLILAWYPAGSATTTDHYGVEFRNGLLLDYTSGYGSSTISYRCGS